MRIAAVDCSDHAWIHFSVAMGKEANRVDDRHESWAGLKLLSGHLRLEEDTASEGKDAEGNVGCIDALYFYFSCVRIV